MSQKIFYLNKSERTILLWFVGLGCCVLLFFYFKGKEEMRTPGDTRDTLNLSQSARRNYSDYSGQRNNYKSHGKHYQSYGNPYQSHGNPYNSYENPYNGKADQSYSPKNQPISEARLHPFDLNRASGAELARLGFSERQIASVMKYRAKGGVYRHPEQMSRISGMTKGQYDKLLPYFTVADEFKPASDFVSIPKADFKEETSSPTEEPFQEKLKPGEKIALNSADTTQLKKIPGIGSSRAAQIVKYRERLGGFYSLDQLNDLRNIPADVQKHLALDSVPLRKIHINHLSAKQLLHHPYISFFQAKAICDYRRLKGKISTLDELKQEKNFTNEAIRRLKPYVGYD